MTMKVAGECTTTVSTSSSLSPAVTTFVDVNPTTTTTMVRAVAGSESTTLVAEYVQWSGVWLPAYTGRVAGWMYRVCFSAGSAAANGAAVYLGGPAVVSQYPSGASGALYCSTTNYTIPPGNVFATPLPTVTIQFAAQASATFALSLYDVVAGTTVAVSTPNLYIRGGITNSPYYYSAASAMLVQLYEFTSGVVTCPPNMLFGASPASAVTWSALQAMTACNGQAMGSSYCTSGWGLSSAVWQSNYLQLMAAPGCGCVCVACKIPPCNNVATASASSGANAYMYPLYNPFAWVATFTFYYGAASTTAPGQGMAFEYTAPTLRSGGTWQSYLGGGTGLAWSLQATQSQLLWGGAVVQTVGLFSGFYASGSGAGFWRTAVVTMSPSQVLTVSVDGYLLHSVTLSQYTSSSGWLVNFGSSTTCTCAPCTCTTYGCHCCTTLVNAYAYVSSFTMIPHPGLDSTTAAAGRFYLSNPSYNNNNAAAAALNVLCANTATCTITATQAALGAIGYGLPWPAGIELRAALSCVAAPMLAAISPAIGGSGLAMTVTGSTFDASCRPVFSISGPCINTTFVSSTTLACVIPPAAATGAQAVVVVCKYWTTTTSATFTYIPVPQVTTLNPAAGYPGNNITITGINFGSTLPNLVATVGSIPCTFLSILTPGTTLLCTAASNGLVLVQSFGVGTSAVIFQSLVSPLITNAVPSVNLVCNSPVNITGSNFTYPAFNVFVGGVPCSTLTVVTDSLCICVLPLGLTGNQSLTASIATTPQHYGPGAPLFLLFLAGPNVTSVYPTSGNSYSVMTITGTQLGVSSGLGIQITVGTEQCTFLSLVVLNATTGLQQVTCLVPSNLGNTTYSVFYSYLQNFAPQSATFTYNPATIVSVTPQQVPVTGAVTIAGVNFPSYLSSVRVSLVASNSSSGSTNSTNSTASQSSYYSCGSLVLSAAGNLSQIICAIPSSEIGPLGPSEVAVFGVEVTFTNGGGVVVFDSSSSCRAQVCTVTVLGPATFSYFYPDVVFTGNTTAVMLVGSNFYAAPELFCLLRIGSGTTGNYILLNATLVSNEYIVCSVPSNAMATALAASGATQAAFEFGLFIGVNILTDTVYPSVCFGNEQSLLTARGAPCTWLYIMPFMPTVVTSLCPSTVEISPSASAINAFGTSLYPSSFLSCLLVGYENGTSVWSEAQFFSTENALCYIVVDGIGGVFPLQVGMYMPIPASVAALGVASPVTLSSLAEAQTLTVLDKPSALRFIVTPPSSYSNDGILLPKTMVGIYDSFGQLITQSSIAVLVYISPPPAYIFGYFASSVNGIVTFDSLSFRGQRNATYTLTFSSGTLLPLVSTVTITSCQSESADSVADFSNGNDGTSCVCVAGYEPQGSLCSPCLPGFYKATVSNEACVSCNENFDTGQRTGSASASACVCIAGYYQHGDSCESCATKRGITCNGDNIITTNPGYWRANSSSVKAFQCLNQFACLGGVESTCAAGYTGRLCANCLTSFMKVSTTCLQCFPYAASVLLVIVGTGLLVFLFSRMLHMVVVGGTTSIRSIILKIFLSHLQTYAFLGEFNANWPTAVLRMFQVPALATLKTQFVSVTCIANLDYFTGFLLLLLIPIFIVGALALWYVVLFFFAWARRRQRPNVYRFVSDFLQGCVLGLYLVHPGLISEVIKIFKCRALGKGTSYLISDMSVSCHSSTWRLWSAVAAIYVVVYGFGLIVYGTYALYQFYRAEVTRGEEKIRRDTQLSTVTRETRVGDGDGEGEDESLKSIVPAGTSTAAASKMDRQSLVITSFGFILQGYKRECFYWESVVLMRKLLIVIISVFFTSIFQIVAGIFVLMAACELHERYSPYQTALLYRLDLIGMRTLIFTLMMSIIYYLRNNNIAVSEGLSVPLIFLNSVTILVFLYAIKYPALAKKDLDALWKTFIVTTDTKKSDDDAFNVNKISMRKNTRRMRPADLAAESSSHPSPSPSPAGIEMTDLSATIKSE